MGIQGLQNGAAEDLRAFFNSLRGGLLLRQGQITQAQALLRASLPGQAAQARPALCVDGLRFLALAEWFTGSYPEAQALLQGRLEALAHPPSDGFCQVKHNTSRTVYRGRVGEAEIYLKHYHAPSLLRRLARRLGRSDALRDQEARRFRCYPLRRGWSHPAERYTAGRLTITR